MVTEIEIQDLVQKFGGAEKTFAEFLGELFKDKFIEIYFGESYEEVSTEQVSTSYPAVFCGKVIAAYKTCLIVNGAYVNNKKMQIGNIIFINESAIKAVTEIDGKGILEELLLRSKESLNVKTNFINK